MNVPSAAWAAAKSHPDQPIVKKVARTMTACQMATMLRTVLWTDLSSDSVAQPSSTLR